MSNELTWEQVQETYSRGTILRVPLQEKKEDKGLLFFAVTNKFNGKLHISDLAADRQVAYSIFESLSPGDLLDTCVTGYQETRLTDNTVRRTVILSKKVIDTVDSLFVYEADDGKLISDLKLAWSIAESEALIFTGKFTLNQATGRSGFFNEVTLEDKIVSYPDGQAVSSFFCSDIRNLQEGEFYEFHVCPAPANIRKNEKRPWKLNVDILHPVVYLPAYLNPRSYVRDLFTRRGATPEDAQVIAAQLKGNEMALYTSTERFIFELLQNADDMPFDNNGVSVHYVLEEDYLLFMHNGQPFRRADVKAISSNGMSNKKKDTQKTGYKGIGFKSVFTDSEKVYISSGGFSFSYDKEYPDYNNFDHLYQGYFKKLRPEDAVKERDIYKGHEAEYTDIESIPWQIKPVWVDRKQFEKYLPLAGQVSSNLLFGLSRVAIALYIGRRKIAARNYKRVLERLFSDPRFLLFLRQVRAIRLKTGTDIVRVYRTERDGILTIRRTLAGRNLHLNYMKPDEIFSVPVSDEGFQKSGTGLTKKEVKACSGDQPAEYHLVDSFGQKVEDVPLKLVQVSETVLSFAVPYENGKLKRLPRSEAAIFSYLPTTDVSFGFPFLINGDFVLTQNRENVIPSNHWNQHLFYYIAYYHFRWLSLLARQTDLRETYLNVLVQKKYKAADNAGERQEIYEAFNRGYEAGKDVFAFIHTMDGRIVKATECMVDHTGFSALLPVDTFSLLSGTQLPVVETQIDWQKLAVSDLDIAGYTVRNLITDLAVPERIEILNKWLNGISNADFPEVLEKFNNIWFNPSDPGQRFLFSDENSIEIMQQLQLFRMSDSSSCSLEDIKRDNRLVIHRKSTFAIKNELEELGFITTATDISAYSNVFHKISDFLESDAELFQKIREFSKGNTLTADRRKIMFCTAEALRNVGPDALKKWELFSSSANTGSTVMLGELTGPAAGLPIWLEGNVIAEADYFSVLDSYLIPSDQIYEKLIHPNIEVYLPKVRDGLAFYQEVTNFYRQNGTSVFNHQPVYFTGSRFASRKGIFYHPKLIQFDSCETLSELISRIGARELPAPAVLPYLSDPESPFFVPKEDMLSEVFISETLPLTLARAEAVIMLDFCVMSSDLLFSQFSLVEKNGRFELISGETIQYYSVSQQLNELLGDSVFSLLSADIFNENLKAAGLLIDGPQLLKAVSAELGFRYELAALYRDESRAIKAAYLSSLEQLNLDSSLIYDRSSAEYELLKLMADVLGDELVPAEKLREKIFIDSLPLNSLIYSDTLHLTKKDITVRFSLSDLLPAQQEAAKSVSLIIEQLGPLGLKALEETLFITQEMPAADVYNALAENDEPLLVPQIVFVAIFWPEKTGQFDFASLEGIEMVEFVRDLNPAESAKVIYQLTGINLTLMVYPGQWAAQLSDEILPGWLNEWAELGAGNKSFLKSAGLNTEGSDVVKLRSYLSGSGSEPDDVMIATLNRGNFLSDTLNWLSERYPELSSSSRQAYWLKKIYEQLTPTSDLPVPCVHKIIDNLEILRLREAENLYRCSDPARLQKVFSVVTSHEGRLLADNFLNPSWIRTLEITDVEFSQAIDIGMLEDASEWESSWYKEFCTSSPLRIYIHDGAIPYSVCFLNQVIDRYEGGNADQDGQIIYINSQAGDILSTLEQSGLLGFEDLKNLYKSKAGDIMIAPHEKEILDKARTLGAGFDELLRLAELGKRLENYNKQPHQEHRQDNYGSDINPGLVGEQKVHKRLIELYGEARVKWISEKNTANNLTYGTNHDFEILTPDLEDIQLYIDVKSTISAKYAADKIPIEIRTNEWDFFENNTNGNYIIARVFDVNSASAEIKFLKMELYRH